MPLLLLLLLLLLQEERGVGLSLAKAYSRISGRRDRRQPKALINPSVLPLLLLLLLRVLKRKTVTVL